MKQTSRVLVAMGAATLLTYGTALAQAPAQPPQAPPSAPSPSTPSAPQSPITDRAERSDRTQSATGELVSVDAKADTLTIKTATGNVIIKYDDDTKVTGASRNTAGLATMSGAQLMVNYKKDGSDNLATSIEVKPSAGVAPRPAAPGGFPSDRPGDRPFPDSGRPVPDSERPSPDGPPSPRP